MFAASSWTWRRMSSGRQIIERQETCGEGQNLETYLSRAAAAFSSSSERAARLPVLVFYAWPRAQPLPIAANISGSDVYFACAWRGSTVAPDTQWVAEALTRPLGSA